jgi:hypothetical protein
MLFIKIRFNTIIIKKENENLKMNYVRSPNNVQGEALKVLR